MMRLKTLAARPIATSLAQTWIDPDPNGGNWPGGDRPDFAGKPEKRPIVQLPANVPFRPIANIR